MNVGDYVRTKKRGFQPPQIARIKSISMKRDRCYHNQYYIELDHNLIPDYEFHIYEKDIEKSSPSIIDLIEIGDYVNGYKVISIGIDDNHKNVELYVANQGYDELVLEQDIKSIVTKEMFANAEYRVETN